MADGKRNSAGMITAKIIVGIILCSISVVVLPSQSMPVVELGTKKSGTPCAETSVEPMYCHKGKMRSLDDMIFLPERGDATLELLARANRLDGNLELLGNSLVAVLLVGTVSEGEFLSMQSHRTVMKRACRELDATRLRGVLREYRLKV